jgi:thiazole biosynthesis/tRNA modification protein ThiI
MELKIDTILLRYGELFLKGNNVGFFESILTRNIKRAAGPYGVKVSGSRGRYFVEGFREEDLPALISSLSKVFGLHSLSPAVKIKTDFDVICAAAAEFSPKNGSFRVTAKRADKRLALNSTEIGALVGGYMLEKSPDLKVDLENFDFELNIDIRENGYSYLFYQNIPCSGGLPSGSAGRAVALISGGIDSPVAIYRMAKRGLSISAVHFYSYPYTSELALQKVVDLSKKLSPYVAGYDLTVVPFTDIQYAIHQNCPSEYMITLMRRFMMRIAEKIARQKGAGALVTGESLGQVASQTMESITVTNSVSSLPVFRPLIGSDKDEIIREAKRLETYDISIRPYEDCCTVFLPKSPVIRPTIEKAKEFEKKLDTDKLIDEAVKNSYNVEI